MKGQKFQGVWLKMKPPILTFRDLAYHLCQKTWEWLVRSIWTLKWASCSQAWFVSKPMFLRKFGNEGGLFQNHVLLEIENEAKRFSRNLNFPKQNVPSIKNVSNWVKSRLLTPCWHLRTAVWSFVSWMWRLGRIGPSPDCLSTFGVLYKLPEMLFVHDLPVGMPL